MIQITKNRESAIKSKVSKMPISEGINNSNKDVERILTLLSGKKPSVLIIIEAIKLKMRLEKENNPDVDTISLIENALKKHEPVKWLPPIYW